jgi:chemotaxis protein histidine kinase CheA
MNKLVHHDWPGGGTAVDRIKEQLDMLSELDEKSLAELQSAIVAEFETVEKEEPTPQTVDAMTSLADMLDTVRGEVSRREAQAEELAARAAEAATRVKGAAEDMPKAEDAETPAEDAMDPAEEPAAPEKAPTAEEDDAKKKPMEASAAAIEGSELSTDTEPTATVETTITTEEAAPAEFSVEEPKEEAVAVAEEAPAVTASAEGEVMPEATPEVAPEESAPAEAAVVEAPAEVTADAAVVVEVDAEASSTTQETAQTEQKEQEAPVTAAVSSEESFEAPADRRPVAQASVATVAITAGADIPGYTAGSSVNDMKEVAELMAKRLHGLRRVNGGDGEQHIVASVSTQYPESRILTQDAEGNWAKVQAVTGPEALVASGGHQAPFTTKYDIFGLGTTARPVRDALPKFQADRGGIRFITPPALSAYGNAVGVWTAANDSAETPGTKSSLTVTAASETTVATDAVTLQMQFGNLMSRAYPELIARHNELGLVQHAREAEGQILTRLTALSTAVTSTSLIGMGRDYLVQLGRAAANYRGRHRLEADAPLRVIAPAWVRDAMAADLAIAAPGDNTLNAYAEIEGYIASRGINMTWHIDGFDDSQGSGAMNEFGDTFVWYIFAEGTFLFLDGGTLDLGVIRDSTLVGTNDYKMFVETFEGVAKVGIESLKVTSTINVNGVAAALRDTTGGATAAAIEY